MDDVLSRRDREIIQQRGQHSLPILDQLYHPVQHRQSDRRRQILDTDQCSLDVIGHSLQDRFIEIPPRCQSLDLSQPATGQAEMELGFTPRRREP
jgi:hypothetical protein